MIILTIITTFCHAIPCWKAVCFKGFIVKITKSQPKITLKPRQHGALQILYCYYIIIIIISSYKKVSGYRYLL